MATKSLTESDKEVFVKGIAPFCQSFAVEKFVDTHHVEPKREEVDHLARQMEEATVQFLENKVARFHQASVLLIEWIPQLFSKEALDEVMGEFKKSMESLQDKLNLSTESLSTCFEVGKYLFKQRRHAEAGDIFEMLVFLNPRYTSAWLDLGLSLHEQGKLQEALQAYAATYFLDPKPLYARMKSIEAYLALKQKSDAMAEFDELEQLVYTNPDPVWKETLQTLAKKIGEMK